MKRTVAPLLPLLLLAACGGQSSNAVEKFALDDIAPHVPHIVAASPDTKGAVWEVLDGGRALRFGMPGEKPFLTMRCELAKDAPPMIRIIRLTPADPHAKALFALVGPREAGRIPADAHPDGKAWRWESVLPAEDPQLKVFLDGGTIEATLPGGGTLKLARSGEPGRLVTWCRQQAPKTPEAPPAPQE
ncbi:MAG: hypothetical protein PHE36_14830 [Novosphingobium sp.]|nr:hypothetical protein [Novosphingobium sp.]